MRDSNVDQALTYKGRSKLPSDEYCSERACRGRRGVEGPCEDLHIYDNRGAFRVMLNLTAATADSCWESPALSTMWELPHTKAFQTGGPQHIDLEELPDLPMGLVLTLKRVECSVHWYLYQ